MADIPNRKSRLINNLAQSDRFPHDSDDIRVVETHISWVIMTGPFAYKLKKPVDLDFLDFTELERRQYYCEEEIRLNKRTAPELYEQVLPITGTPANPNLNGKGTVIEWCVKMRQFSEENHLPNQIQQRHVNRESFQELARFVADLHQSVDRAETDSIYGEPETVRNAMVQNFTQIDPLLSDPDLEARIRRLQSWATSRFEEDYGWFERRKTGGYIRECHGDMHLRNMYVQDGSIKLFDAIEFNKKLRWIDVINDVACLLVDLDIHDCQHWEHQFLNTYLNWTADYEGVALLRFYRVYRAMVRAKVSLMSSSQQRPPDTFFNYLKTAESYMEQRNPFLVITRGVTASGKSTVSRHLLERMNLIRIQSDVVRKQIHNMDPDETSDSELNEGLYTQQANYQTYETLAENARILLQAGYPVIVDACFLDKDNRRHFRELALSLDLPFHILDVSAPESRLRERVKNREADPSEADLEVLEYQFKTEDPLGTKEAQVSLSVNTANSVDCNQVEKFLCVT